MAFIVNWSLVKEMCDKARGKKMSSAQIDHELWWQATLSQGQNPPSVIPPFAQDMVPVTPKHKSSSWIETPNAPSCKSCNIQMVIKSNRETGQQFYGCPNYREKRCKSIPLPGESRKGYSGAWSPALQEQYDEYAMDIGDR